MLKDKFNNSLIEKTKYTNVIHILIILVGAIFMLSTALHKNIWFDETYTLGLVNHNFIDLIKIGSADVHPLFYYIFAKVFSLIFGNSIISLRIFSLLGILTLSIIGYTHIRKDFGEKTGIIYSFLSMFLPVMILYSTEIRMYSWAAVFVTLTGIYAYRIIKKESSIKNWAIFGIFSLISANTHYFAMLAIGIINIMLFIYVVKNKKYIKEFLITGISQIVLFIPALIVFIKQATRVAGGFWIKITYPDVFFEILNFNFLGNIESKTMKVIIFAFASFICLYMIVNIIKNKKSNSNINACIWAVIVYFGVIALSLVVSIKTDIFTTRYTIPMVGLLIFAISYIFSLENKKWLISICAIFIVCLFGMNVYNLYKVNYDETNEKIMQVMNDNIKDEDIIIYKEIGVGSIVAIQYPSYNQYFYNAYHWTVEEAYKAYAPQMQTVEDLSFLENYNGRIIIIDADNTDLFNEIKDKSNITVEKEPEKIDTAYKNIKYNVSIVNKAN